MDSSASSATTNNNSNNPQEPEEPKEESESNIELMNPEQEAIYKRRLELKRTQQDLIKLVNRLHEFVNRDRNGVTTDSSSCGDVMMENNNEEDGVDWELLTNYVNQHVTELQEIRSLSSFTGLLLNRIKKIISGPGMNIQKPEGASGSAESGK